MFMFQGYKIKSIETKNGDIKTGVDKISIILSDAKDDDTGLIELAISNERECCEKWGMFISEDNIHDFIGAQINNVTIVDESLKNYDIPIIHRGDDRIIYTTFVNIDTSAGLLQLAVYNMHNGYYGHEVTLKYKTKL